LRDGRILESCKRLDDFGLIREREKARDDRSGRELAALGLKNQRLVVNGVFTPEAPGDEVADAMAERPEDRDHPRRRAQDYRRPPL
jgi:hypothetical protein